MMWVVLWFVVVVGLNWRNGRIKIFVGMQCKKREECGKLGGGLMGVGGRFYNGDVEC